MKSGTQISRILLVGPTVPPIGGTRVSFQNLLSEIEETFSSENLECLLIPLVHSNSWLRKVVLEIGFFVKILFLTCKADALVIHTNANRHLKSSWIYVIWAQLMGKPVQLRFFGADLDLLISEGGWNAFVFRKLCQAEQVLLQTKGLIEVVSKSCEANFIWFPTSRNPQIIRRSISPSERPLKLLYVGHVKEEKGINELIKAFLALDGCEIELNIVGRLSNSVEIIEEKRIVYHGELGKLGVEKLLSESHVFVFPSYWRGEGYPGAVLEAMTAELPIISTNWRYLSELVVNGDNGILVPPRDSDALRDAIKWMYENPDQLKRMGESSREKGAKFDSRYWNGKYFMTTIKDLL